MKQLWAALPTDPGGCWSSFPESHPVLLLQLSAKLVFLMPAPFKLLWNAAVPHNTVFLLSFFSHYFLSHLAAPALLILVSSCNERPWDLISGQVTCLRSQCKCSGKHSWRVNELAKPHVRACKARCNLCWFSFLFFLMLQEKARQILCVLHKIFASPRIPQQISMGPACFPLGQRWKPTSWLNASKKEQSYSQQLLLPPLPRADPVALTTSSVASS